LLSRAFSTPSLTGSPGAGSTYSPSLSVLRNRV
jgi:hypothetical protein